MTSTRTALVRSPRRWTLRTRLVATQLALVAAVSLVVGLVSVFALNRLMTDRLAQQLTDASDRAVRFGPHPPGSLGTGTGGPTGTTGATGTATATPSPSGSEAGHESEESRTEPRTPPELLPGNGPGSLVATRSPGSTTLIGRMSLSGIDQLQRDLTAAELSRLATVRADDRPHVVEMGERLGAYLVIARTTPTGSLVVNGMPMGDVQATVLGLTLIISGVTLAGLLAAGVAGTATIRVALRPLRRVAATARRVAQLPLDRGEVALAVRVPQADTDDRTEVGQVGHAINRMLEHVASALQARQDSEMRVRRFVSDASHELRTPLASIRGYAELTRRTRAQMSPDVAHAMERVEAEARRMTDLVEELLLLARLDEGRPLDREPVDLSQLVVDAVSDAHVAGAGHRWSLDLPEEPVSVIGDQRRLHQVIANILANARTHTPPGSRVTVTLATRDGVAEVRIADDGPGIPPDLLPEVFERFARADGSRSRAAGSTGLGLAIVQAVVRAHGGRVGVSSRPGETVFTVLLPLDPAGAQEIPAQPATSAAAG